MAAVDQIQQRQAKIIGGGAAREGAWPWLAGLLNRRGRRE